MSMRNGSKILQPDDSDSLALIAQLQKDDLAYLLSRSKGKQKKGRLTDAELALQLSLEELSLYEHSASDYAMALSMASAVASDNMLVRDLTAADELVVRDHQLARQLGSSINGDIAQLQEIELAKPNAQDTWDDLTIAKFVARQVASRNKEKPYYHNGKHFEAECSRSAVRRKPTKVEERIHCLICTDSKPWFNTVKAPCGDDYCEECISQLFEKSMKDESLYPPRCCSQTIPLSTVSIFLRPGLFETFNKKRIELDTQNRIYCHKSTCNVFIPTDGIANDVATCPKCQRNTCTICRHAAHKGDCPEDTVLQQVLQTALDAGWQRCYQCKRLVELNAGCHHITCRCNAQFCYVCGKKWKTCACPQWDEQRLLNRAETVINRQGDADQRRLAATEEAEPIPPEGLHAPPPAYATVLPDTEQYRMQAMADYLRGNHECDHEHWSLSKMLHRCEECYSRLPQLTFECDQCGLRACFKCRRNRF